MKLTLSQLEDFVEHYEKYLEEYWKKHGIQDKRDITHCAQTQDVFLDKFLPERNYFKYVNSNNSYNSVEEQELKYLGDGIVWVVEENDDEDNVDFDEGFDHTYTIIKIDKDYYRLDSWLNRFPIRLEKIEKIKFYCTLHIVYRIL